MISTGPEGSITDQNAFTYEIFVPLGTFMTQIAVDYIQMKEAEYSREFDLIPVHFGRAVELL